LTNFITIKMHFLSADRTSHCSTDNGVLARRVHQPVCIYHAEMPITKAFSEDYTKADYREVGNLESEVAFKLILLIFLSGVQTFPAIIGIFSTSVNSDL